MNGEIVSCGRATFVFVLAFLSSVVPKILGSCVWSVRKFVGAKVFFVETGLMCIRCRLNQELMAVVGSPEGGTLVFGVRWQWPVLSHDVFILDQSSTYVFYYAPWGCVLIGLGGTRLFCLECPFPSLSVCGLSYCPIMGMGVVLKFCNLQYGCSTVCLAVFSGFVFRIVVISHFVDFTVV